MPTAVLAALGRCRVGVALALLACSVSAAESAIRMAAFGNLPLSFEPCLEGNCGEVKFLSRGSGYTLSLTSTEAVLALPGASVRMKLLGANPAPQVAGRAELPGKVNYYLGNDPAKWRTGVPTYARVEFRGVYPGINLVYYGTQRQLEYDFVVAPDADPRVIRLGFEGVKRVTLDASGDLVLGEELRLRKPVVYQELDGARQAVATCYVLRGRRRVGFHVGAYDVSRRLIIDPLVLTYSTYLGGRRTDSRIAHDAGNAIAVDTAGNAYVTGYTNSTNFPTVNPVRGSYGSLNCGVFPGNLTCRDAFVTKFNATGSALVYSTYLGGSVVDFGNGIAVDGSGNAYVTGYTDSSNFPTLNPMQTGKGLAFVAKLNATGALVYSTLLGAGALNEQGNAIAVDAAGNAYVAGVTDSSSFPTTTGSFRTTPRPLSDLCNIGSPAVRPCRDGFVAKINTAGSALVYSTYLGGSGKELETSANGIAVDSSGNAYVTGFTQTTNFPTANALQATYGGGTDAFVTKLNAAGSALVYSTYLGGSGIDQGYGIAVDAGGNAYVTGNTFSTNFPLASPVQSAYGGSSDVFVAKLNPAGSALVYSTYLGGSGYDYGNAIAVDTSGDAYVTGQAVSTNFPLASPLQATKLEGGDVFVAKFNPTGSALLYSTYLGGDGRDHGYGIAIDSSGSAYVTGITSSTDFPAASPFQAAKSDGDDAFVAKIEMAANNPAPTLRSLSPSIAKVGGAGFTLTVIGSGFVPESVLRWNGADRTTTFVGWGQLRAAIAASDVAAAGTAQVTAFTPGPGGGASNALTFTSALVPNDNFANALVITATPSSDTVDTTTATTETSDAVPYCPDGTIPSKTVWYRFNPTSNVIVTVDTVGSNYNTVLSVWSLWTATPVAATLGRVACSVAASGRQSQVVFAADWRYSYYFMVGASGNQGGMLVFNLTSQAGPVPTPTLSSLSPSSVSAGRSDFILTLTGSGFLGQSRVTWGNAALSKGFLSTTQLQAKVFGTDVRNPGTVQVRVDNADTGGGFSNALTFTINPSPVLNPGGVVNGASFAAGKPVAAGSIVSLFGQNFALANAFAGGVPLPTTLGGTSLQVDFFKAAPLFFVSPLQINFQVPWDVSSYPSLTVNEVFGSRIDLTLATYAPGIFTTTQTGSGQGAILIANTDFVAAPGGSIPGRNTRPAKRGEFISIFCTGLGPVTNRPANGAAASGDPPSTTTTAPSVTIGGVPARVDFSGLAPGFVGLYQVNVQAPDNAPTGDAVELVLSIGGATSNTVTIAVQ